MPEDKEATKPLVGDGPRPSEFELYGQDAEEWLARWDRGEGVWSVEMGGLGPGYEQAIQITVAEILRWLLEQKPHADRFDNDWPALRDEISAAVCAREAVDRLGLSGAQWGAALSLATYLYRNGPVAMMEDEKIADRHIQVSRNFPR